jgi:pimeloyl-ACP methyl ester carboxylesterase
MKPVVIAAVVFVAGLSIASVAHGQARPAAPANAAVANDYSTDASWLCRPGRHDACDIDLSTTVVSADGSVRKEPFHANPNAPIDCFYVYPTISTDTGDNSDLTPDPAELNVIAQQFARFAQVCRVFAPMYRQVTLAGLRRIMATGLGGLADGVQYDDVSDAWHYYLEHDNHGRGVALIGHSQGSFILTSLIAREIDGRPVQSRLVSAILMGTSIPVPRAKDAGGAFQKIPLCHKATETGCLITFATFRSTVPPPANTLFGRVPDASMEAACTNPAALGGGRGELHAYLDAKGRTIASTSALKPWTTSGAPIDTPWVSVPGLLTAECSTNENATFLQVTVHGNPADPRTDDITGDLGNGGQVLANWGLHLIDVNLAMGNLLDIVSQQAKAFAAKK